MSRSREAYTHTWQTCDHVSHQFSYFAFLHTAILVVHCCIEVLWICLAFSYRLIGYWQVKQYPSVFVMFSTSKLFCPETQCTNRIAALCITICSDFLVIEVKHHHKLTGIESLHTGDGHDDAGPMPLPHGLCVGLVPRPRKHGGVEVESARSLRGKGKSTRNRLRRRHLKSRTDVCRIVGAIKHLDSFAGLI